MSRLDWIAVKLSLGGILLLVGAGVAVRCLLQVVR